jgi:hypothetical protein
VSFKNAKPLREKTNASKDFFVQENKLAEQLESDINEWGNKVGFKAEVRYGRWPADEFFRSSLWRKFNRPFSKS